MNTKRLAVIIVAVAFSLALLFSCVGLLTVQKIQVNFSVLSYSTNSGEYASETSEEVQKLLDEYIGCNLLTLELEEVEQKLVGHPRLEIVKLEKKYPNEIIVEIKERREVYSYTDTQTGKEYILNEDGYVLSDTGVKNQDYNIIELYFDNINVLATEIGRKIKIENDTDGLIVKSILNIAQKVGLADCINSMKVKDYTGNEYDIFFKTHTGVEIQIVDVLIEGEEKALEGFNLYDTLATDYQKRFGIISSAYVLKDGVKILAVDYQGIHGDDILFEKPLSE